MVIQKVMSIHGLFVLNRHCYRRDMSEPYETVKVKCPICKENVEFDIRDVLEGLNVLICPKCQKGIVFNNISDN